MNDNKPFKVTILSDECGIATSEFQLSTRESLSRFIFSIADRPFTQLIIERGGSRYD